MGPKRRSLAYLFPGLPRRKAALLAALLVAPGAGALAADEPPLLPFTERQDVRRVQIDVSVIDPKGDGLASVPGLTRDMFELRLDGVSLTPEQLARVEFDEICPARRAVADVARDNGLADDRPTLIVLADLNFLDLRMRHAAARAIEELSQMAARQPLRVKVLAYTRELIPLTSDFTTDPKEIADAGRALIGIAAAGPPLGGLTAVPDRVDQREPIDSRSLSEQTDASAPVDPNRQTPAFTIDLPSSLNLYDVTGKLRFASSQSFDLATRDVDPRPSLSALETVLMSHAALRGRKALILFTSSWFDLPESFWLTYLTGPRQAAQGGFTIWGVDARGLTSGSGDHESEVLSYLAASTGGDLVRSAGRLAVAFERALSQLSCYYLFTIPTPAPKEGLTEHNVDVRLNTQKHPEFWGYRVRTVTGVTLLDAVQARQKRQLAALMEPDAHRIPEVRLTASYPVGESRPVTTIEISALLSDLTFSAEKTGGGVSARFALQGLVTDSAGRTVCRLGDGQERRIRTGEPPARFPPSVLVLSTTCALPGPGTYITRVIVEDRSTDDIGAATAWLEYAPVTHSLARVSALRLGRNSGRDFLLDLAGARTVGILRDRERRAFVPLNPTEGILPQDRLLLRFVACGVAEPPTVILYQRRVDPENGAAPALKRPRALFQTFVARRAEQKGAAAVCGEFEAVVPENALAPGEYGLMLLEPPPPEKDQLLPGQRRMLGAMEFRVLSPPAPPPEKPGREA